MPPAESHILAITQTIQLAIAPVFLLTAVAGIINALTGRLARAVDRRRVIEDDLLPRLEGVGHDEKMMELRILRKRIHLVLWAIALAVLSALLVCLLIGVAFSAAFLGFDLSRVVAALFVGSVLSLTCCLMAFMREVYLAALTFHPSLWAQAAREPVERR